jgi:hypothetical protein
MEYLILESGSYSDYSMDFLEVPENSTLTETEMLLLLNVDIYEAYSVAGRIKGELIGVEPMVLKTKAAYEINSLFCCYENRIHKTVLDRLYTKDELLVIATDNDGSGHDYWKISIEQKYKKYVRAFNTYKKLLEGGE